MNVGLVRDSCSAVVIPITFSFFAIRFPTPIFLQPAAGIAALPFAADWPESAPARRGIAATLFDAHCADFASVFLWRRYRLRSSGRCHCERAHAAACRRLQVYTVVDTADVQEAFVDGVLLNAGR